MYEEMHVESEDHYLSVIITEIPGHSIRDDGSTTTIIVTTTVRKCFTTP